ncbi:MAG: tRNA glutamyl-Q(34) synthetase GluQRS [Parvularculaceae bacterium]
MASDFVTRFAPSPTGFLHLGHAYSAIMAWRAARRAGGRLLLRIEDIDRTRSRPEFEDAIFEDLRWLGIDWDGEERRQSDHFADYEAALRGLIDRGLVYRCFKTRKEVLAEIARAPHAAPNAAFGETPAYVGGPPSPADEKRLLAENAPFAWRLSLEQARAALGPRYEALSYVEEDMREDGAAGPATTIAAKPGAFGDAVVARKDAGTSYHLASVHDDAFAGVTHVVRSVDLCAAASLHALLQALLAAPTPVYRHHRLIANADGERLSKRDGALSLRALRAGGATPTDVYRQVGLAP